MRCLGLLARVITVLNTGDGVSAGWWVGPVRMFFSLCLLSLSEKQPNLSSCVHQGLTMSWYVSEGWVGGQPFSFLSFVAYMQDRLLQRNGE